MLQGPAFGTTASYHEGRHVVATAQGPTFATEKDVVDILLLAGVAAVHCLFHENSATTSSLHQGCCLMFA